MLNSIENYFKTNKFTLTLPQRTDTHFFLLYIIWKIKQFIEVRCSLKIKIPYIKDYANEKKENKNQDKNIRPVGLYYCRTFYHLLFPPSGKFQV